MEAQFSEGQHVQFHYLSARKCDREGTILSHKEVAGTILYRIQMDPARGNKDSRSEVTEIYEEEIEAL